MVKIMHEKRIMNVDSMRFCKQLIGEKITDMRGMKTNNMNTSTMDNYINHH